MSTNITNFELFLKERAMIVTQAMPLWKGLCATIRQKASERSLRENKSAPGANQLIVGSRTGHMVLTLDTVPSIQFEVYRTQRQEKEEAEIKDSLIFDQSADRVLLASTEGN